MAQDLAGIDSVGVGSSLPGVGEIAGLFEVGNDLLDGAFGEAAARGDVADPGAVVVGDGCQYARVIRDERPSGVWLGYSIHVLTVATHYSRIQKHVQDFMYFLTCAGEEGNLGSGDGRALE